MPRRKKESDVPVLSKDDIEFFMAMLYDKAVYSLNGVMYRSNKKYARAYNSFMSKYDERNREWAEKKEEEEIISKLESKGYKIIKVCEEGN